MIRVRICALVALATVLSCAQEPPAAHDFQSLNDRGRTLIRNNDLNGAEQLFRRAAETARQANDPVWEAEF